MKENINQSDVLFDISHLFHTFETETGESFSALKDISLKIHKGEFVAIIGTNGSGKSTLARHLNALMLPTKGTVSVEGMLTSDMEYLWDIRQRVGMVFQNPDNQLVAAVVEEDVAFGPENLGVPTEEIITRVDDALERVGMIDYRKQAPSMLSGGQKQRVAIAGVLAMKLPTKGTVSVEGMLTSDMEYLWDIRQRVGMVFQNPDNQLVAAVVEEDVAFGPENLGVPTEEIITRVDDALERVGMIDYRKQAPSMLSGGQKQRVAIAGVLAMKPDCIVLDEPTAMLDPKGRQEVMETIHELNEKEGITIVLITHFMEEAVTADHIIVIDKGTLQMEGSPKEVFSQVEKLTEIGLDVPIPADLAYRLKKKGLSLSECISNEELGKSLCPFVLKK